MYDLCTWFVMKLILHDDMIFSITNLILNVYDKWDILQISSSIGGKVMLIHPRSFTITKKVPELMKGS